MRFRLSWGLLLAVPLLAQSGPFSFEGFADSAILTTQYSGATFGNAILLTSGITLNELETPPHAGSAVVSDNGGPMTIVFAAPLRGFAGYFTYAVPLNLKALDSSNNVVATANSAFSSNEIHAGASGSHANEFLSVSSSTSIYKVVITGGAQGASFTLDDAIPFSKCDLNEDGVIDVADVQAIVNEALGARKTDDDLNGDGGANVSDVQILTNAALGLGCSAK